MPTGVRTPVVSMSTRLRIGCVNALVQPGMLQRCVHLRDELLARHPANSGQSQRERTGREEARRRPTYQRRT